MHKAPTLDGRLQWLVVLILVSLTLAAFWPVLENDFVLYDDNMNVTGNHQVRQGLGWEGLRWALTTRHGANWHPLTWMSHMLDCQIFGLNPRGHHLTNLVFHLANTVLLLAVLTTMSRAFWQSAFVAALFAVHPMHVESVAWVAERKDVLSTFFWMLTMIAYTRYTQHRCMHRYLAVVALFTLGLMAKPMLVTLPFLLLLLDFWPLSRLGQQPGQPGRQPWITWKLVREKLPFFAFTIASSIVTIVAQRSWGAVQTLEDLSLWARFGNVVVSYTRYIEKMFWPLNLAAFYPHPGNNIPVWQVLGSFLLLVFITALMLRSAGRYRYLAVGWLWYLGTLVPVIGIVQVGGQAMADRYSYVPLVGLFIIIAWGVPDLLSRWDSRKPALVLSATAIISILAVRTWFQVGYWRDSITLFEHAMHAVPRNYLAHNNLGFLLAEQGKWDEAIAQYKEALKIRPRYVHAHNNLGAALAAKGRIDEAMEHYSLALQIRPGQAAAHVNVGIELAMRGRVDEAVFHFSQALRSDPEDAKAHYNLGLILAGQGKLDQAIAHYSRALHGKPDYAEAHVNLGVALAQQGKLDEAIAHYRRALQIKPDYPEAHINMGIEMAGQGKINEAISHFGEAARINPNSAEAHFNLGKAHLYLRNRDAALQQYTILTALNPTLASDLRKMLDQ